MLFTVAPGGLNRQEKVLTEPTSNRVVAVLAVRLGKFQNISLAFLSPPGGVLKFQKLRGGY